MPAHFLDHNPPPGLVYGCLNLPDTRRAGWAGRANCGASQARWAPKRKIWTALLAYPEDQPSESTTCELIGKVQLDQVDGCRSARRSA